MYWAGAGLPSAHSHSSCGVVLHHSMRHSFVQIFKPQFYFDLARSLYMNAHTRTCTAAQVFIASKAKL